MGVVREGPNIGEAGFPSVTLTRSGLGQVFRRKIRQPAIMSCNACFCAVNPAMM